MPISWLCQRPCICLPCLWMQPGSRHQTPRCKLLVQYSAWPTGFQFYSFRGDPRTHCILLLQLFCGPSNFRPTEKGGSRQRSAPSLPPFPPLACWKWPSWSLLRLSARKPGARGCGAEGKPFLLCPWKGVILWQMARSGTEQGRQLNSACGSCKTGIPGTFLIKQPQTTPGMWTLPTLLSCYLLDSWSCQFRKKFLKNI